MPDYIRAVALDYDGTITSEPRPTAPMLAAIRELRSANRRIVLVTGRLRAFRRRSRREWRRTLA